MPSRVLSADDALSELGLSPDELSASMWSEIHRVVDENVHTKHSATTVDSVVSRLQLGDHALSESIRADIIAACDTQPDTVTADTTPQALSDTNQRDLDDVLDPEHEDHHHEQLEPETEPQTLSDINQHDLDDLLDPEDEDHHHKQLEPESEPRALPASSDSSPGSSPDHTNQDSQDDLIDLAHDDDHYEQLTPGFFGWVWSALFGANQQDAEDVVVQTPEEIEWSMFTEITPPPQFSAKKFAGKYRFLENFMSFNCDDRHAACQHELLHPKDPKDEALLAELIHGIRASPTDVDTQKQLLLRLYQLWNRLLADLEEQQWPEQGPQIPISFDSNSMVVVLGGKYRVGDNLRGLGDELVHLLLENHDVQVVSYSRGAADAIPASCSSRYAHHQTLDSLMAQVAADKKDNTKVLFAYTIGVTRENGQCTANDDMMNQFVGACDAHGFLQDKNVRMLQTSSFHASPKEAGYEDNLADNYGLADYGASKVMQTMQLMEATYSYDDMVSSSDAFQHLVYHRKKLQKELQLARAYWAENPADAKARICPEGFAHGYSNLVDTMSQAAHAIFEDTSGEHSIVCQLRTLSSQNRFDTVKIPYMLSNTAVDKRLFVFDPAAQGGKDAWEFFVLCSFKRFRIVITPERGATWHLAFASSLME